MATIISIPASGIAIPTDRVDYYRWQAQALQSYRVEIGNVDGEPFRLHSHRIIIFQQLVYRIGTPEPFVMDQQQYITQHNVESFMQSNLYTSLSSRSTERIAEVLRRLVKARKRVQDIDSEMERLRQLLGNSPENADSLSTMQANRAKRQRQINARLQDLKDFTDAKSVALTEMVNIDEIRKTEWWTEDADQFFEQMMEESFTVEEKIAEPEQPPTEVSQQAA